MSRGLFRSGQDPDGGVFRDAVRAGRDAAGNRQPPPARQLGLRAPALPPARHHRRAHRRGAARRPRADLRRPREDDRADEPRGDGGDPAARLPADARRGPHPPGRRSRHLHRQRGRQRGGRVAGAGAGDGWWDRHPLRGRRRGQLHRPSRRPLCLWAPARSRRCRPSPSATRSTSLPPTPTPTRCPTCRCWKRSATRSPSTRIRLLAEIARQEGWQTMRFERLGRRLIAVATVLLGDCSPASAVRALPPDARGPPAASRCGAEAFPA